MAALEINGGKSLEKAGESQTTSSAKNDPNKLVCRGASSLRRQWPRLRPLSRPRPAPRLPLAYPASGLALPLSWSCPQGPSQYGIIWLGLFLEEEHRIVFKHIPQAEVRSGVRATKGTLRSLAPRFPVQSSQGTCPGTRFLRNLRYARRNPSLESR